MSGRWVLSCILLLTPAAMATSPQAQGEAATAAEPMDTATRTDPGERLVDLNSASVQELCTLPGIGPKKAEAIISLREKRPFTRVTQLLLVRGIGPRTLSRLKPRLVVGPVTSRGPAPPGGP